MSWYKRKDNTWIIKSNDTIFHETVNVTLENMNDPLRDFSSTTTGKFLAEYIDLPEEDNTLLPKGIYHYESNSCGDVIISPWEPPLQMLLFEFAASKLILEDFDLFLDQEQIYRDTGLGLYKRGVLLYGPPGTGKTSCINIIINKLKEKDCVIFYISRAITNAFIKEIKKDKRLKVFIFEELVTLVNSPYLPQFLTFLDGENSVDNSYIIGTTNYPEELPGNIVERKGRFDMLIEMDKTTRSDRKKYLEHFLKREITEEELDLTREYSLAFLKELVLQMLIRKRELAAVLVELEKHKQLVKNCFKKDSERVGFLRGFGNEWDD